jgi:mRNA-degrading endonuclease toxin of MazEF toxin-antitoxin module
MRRGDIFLADLEPTKGKEQRGRRPVMVVSAEKMNQHFPPIVCAISGGGVGTRDAGFTVSLQGACRTTDGVVLCNQIRTLDLKERAAKFVERAPDHIIDEVMSVLQDIFGDE